MRTAQQHSLGSRINVWLCGASAWGAPGRLGARGGQVLAVWSLLGWVAATTFAGRLAVFDLPPHLACRVVSSAPGIDEADVAADQMLVEARINVSTLLTTGHERRVQQILLVVENPQRDLMVFDYAPHTQLTSRFASNITRNRSRSEQQSAGVNASVIPADAASLQANASQGGSTSESIGFETLPPKNLLTASGTMSRGSAVYFKFNATSQTTLEGRRPLTVTYRVPRSWRAGYVYVRCAAYSVTPDKGTRTLCGSGDFLVTLYVEGDLEARKQAIEMSQAELQLRRMAPLVERVTSEASPSLTTRLTSVFKPREKPKTSVPESWLNTVLTSAVDDTTFSFSHELPPRVQSALTHFTAARVELASLNTDVFAMDTESDTVLTQTQTTSAEPLRWRTRATSSTNSL